MTHDKFDQSLFGEMETIMKTKFQMVLDEYESDVKSYILSIDQAILKQDLQNVATYAHPLKSSSMALGFVGLGQIAKDLEVKAKTAMNDNADQFPNDLIELSAMLIPAYSFVHGTIQHYKGR